MATYKEIADRKLKLIERYRSALLEEVLESERAEALVQAEEERFAWKSDFRTRDEINQLYKERKRWDRRFLVDTFVLAIMLLLVVASTPQLVNLVAPKDNFRGSGERRPQAAAVEGTLPATENAGEESSLREIGYDN
ncbi:MAG: hypothetical protein O3A95_06735 [Planctomycetota bacterium]|nr:hypothetical protein [Planctomycetota bacterium]MDA1113978.1 hypothetical protein [Planctomycetota bacterium]